MKKLALLLFLPLIACKAVPERRLTTEELRMVATAQSLTDWGLPGVDARAQTIDVIGEMDGSMRVECRYDSERVPEAKQPLYFVSEARFFPTEIASERMFREDVAAYKEGVERVRGRYLHEHPELLKMGDESYAAYMQNGKTIIGNVFVVRRGRVVHALLVSRIYFGQPDGVRQLFEPMLAAAEKFEKSGT